MKFYFYAGYENKKGCVTVQQNRQKFHKVLVEDNLMRSRAQAPNPVSNL